MVNFEVVSEMAISACCTEHMTNYLPAANAANNPEPLERPNGPEIHPSSRPKTRKTHNQLYPVSCSVSMSAFLQLPGWLHLLSVAWLYMHRLALSDSFSSSAPA
jgi:hypothetical protein